MNGAGTVGSQRARFKKSGNSGSRGKILQNQLTTICLLKAFETFDNWKLSSDNEEAGKFDDVVLEWRGGACLIQAKHREKRKITLDDLLSANQSGDFSLKKYVLSYKEIRTEFDVTNVIVCTNAGLTVDPAKEYLLKRQTIDRDNLLYCQDYVCSFCTFNEDVVPLLKQQIKTNDISDDDIRDFLKHFQCYYDYPSESDLKIVIKQLLSTVRSRNEIFSKISYQDMFNKVTEWCDKPRGMCEYLSEPKIKAMLSEIKSNLYCNVLDQFNVLFENRDFSFDGGKRMVHIVAENGFLLEVLKLFHVLQKDKRKALYIGPDHDDNVQRPIVETFALPVYTFLIIIRPGVPQGTAASEIYSKLGETLRIHSHKKIILVTKAHNNPVVPLGSGNNIYQVIKGGGVTFRDFRKDTRTYLMNKKIFTFQKNKFSLGDILGREESRYEAINSDILEIVVEDKETEILPCRCIEDTDGAGREQALTDVTEPDRALKFVREETTKENEDISLDPTGTQFALIEQKKILLLAKGNVNRSLSDDHEDPTDAFAGTDGGGAGIVKLLLENAALSSRIWKEI